MLPNHRPATAAASSSASFSSFQAGGDWQVADFGMFAEEFSRFELVLEDFGKVLDVFAGSGGDAVLFDRMRRLMTFG